MGSNRIALGGEDGICKERKRRIAKRSVASLKRLTISPLYSQGASRWGAIQKRPATKQVFFGLRLLGVAPVAEKMGFVRSASDG